MSAEYHANITKNRPTPLRLRVDNVAQKIDELADLMEYWKRWRERGHTPNGIRAAVLMVCRELDLTDRLEQQEQIAHQAAPTRTAEPEPK